MGRDYTCLPNEMPGRLGAGFMPLAPERGADGRKAESASKGRMSDGDTPAPASRAGIRSFPATARSAY